MDKKYGPGNYFLKVLNMMNGRKNMTKKVNQS